LTGPDALGKGLSVQPKPGRKAAITATRERRIRLENGLMKANALLGKIPVVSTLQDGTHHSIKRRLVKAQTAMGISLIGPIPIGKG